MKQDNRLGWRIAVFTTFLIAVKVKTFAIILLFMGFLLSYLSHASLIIRHSEDGKLYLYDILDIKKETRNPIDP